MSNYGIPGRDALYNPTTTLWKAFAAYLISLGALGTADVVSLGTPSTLDELLQRWPALLIALAPAAWRAIENYRKNAFVSGPLWEWRDLPVRAWRWAFSFTSGRVGLWLCVIAVAATFPGCMSLAPYSSGALSSNAVTVTESTATEYGQDSFHIQIRSRGDAVAKTSVKYKGETDTTPWDFAVLGEANVESAARVLPLNEGAGAAMAALPDTLAPLIAAFNAAPKGEAGETIKDTILREIIHRVLARVSGGVAP